MNNRETLQSRLGFLMLAAGYVVGLGNVWRFPFVAGLIVGWTAFFFCLSPSVTVASGWTFRN